MKPLFCSIFLLILGSRLATAADSAFSHDNQHVFLACKGKPALIEVDLQKRECRLIDLSNTIKTPINSVAYINAQLILCASTKAIWTYEPAKEKCVKVHNAPGEGKHHSSISDIAYDPKKKEVLAVCGGLYCLSKKQGKWEGVGDRYGTCPRNPVFAENGTLLSLHDGDLWSGSIEREDIPHPDDACVPDLWFVADRYAPLALRVVNSNFSSAGLSSFAVSREMIYGCLAPVHGTDWGSIIRFKRRGSQDKNKTGAEAEEGNLIFDSLEEIAALEHEQCAFLCTSRDGQRTFYTLFPSAKAFLVEKDGKPTPLDIPGFAELVKP